MIIIISSIKEIIDSRELLFALVHRDLMGKYRETFIGFFWNVINPLVMLAVYTFIFSVVFEAKFGDSGVPSNFALYLFCGLVPWTAFAEGLNKSAGVIISHTDMVKRAMLPLEVLPSYAVLSNVVTELIGLGILLAATIIIVRDLSVFVLIVPLLIVAQAFLTLGLGMLFASLTVFFRDMEHVVGVALTVLFFLTPILYPVAMMPEKIRFVIWLNPMALIVTMFRDAILENRMPNLWMLGVFSLWAFVLFAGGLYFFKKTKGEFADVI